MRDLFSQAAPEHAEQPVLPGGDPLRDAGQQSPQAQAFVSTDWQRLHMLAPLVEAYFTEPRQALLSEIRLNESLLGATHVDQLRARITITPAEAPEDSADPVEAAEIAKLILWPCKGQANQQWRF